MINITEPEKAEPGIFGKPIFNLAFRSFFLMAALFSSLGLIIWSLNLNGISVLAETGLSALVWHTHEMLFAFAATVAVGFVLTAVQTWTGVPSVKGKQLALLVAIWFVIRAAIWVNTETSISLAIAATAVWWTLVVITFSRIVFSVNNQRNYQFIPILTVLGSLNTGLLVADVLGYSALAMHLAKTVVIMFCLIMSLVGGRVIPFFTARGANTPPAKSHALIEKIIMPISSIAVAIYVASFVLTMPNTVGVVLIVLGLVQMIRLSGWHSIKTGKVPLLWSLHISYLAMAIGLIVMGASYFTYAITFSTGLHLVTIGAMGLMILAMMSRVSLGHTGRKLDVKPIISWSFTLLIFAALVRVILPILGLHLLGWSSATLLWCLAFGCFLWVYTPILFAPRQDMKFNG